MTGAEASTVRRASAEDHGPGTSDEPSARFHRGPSAGRRGPSSGATSRHDPSEAATSHGPWAGTSHGPSGAVHRHGPSGAASRRDPSEAAHRHGPWEAATSHGQMVPHGDRGCHGHAEEGHRHREADGRLRSPVTEHDRERRVPPIRPAAGRHGPGRRRPATRRSLRNALGRRRRRLPGKAPACPSARRRGSLPPDRGRRPPHRPCTHGSAPVAETGHPDSPLRSHLPRFAPIGMGCLFRPTRLARPLGGGELAAGAIDFPATRVPNRRRDARLA
ncbi:hypothetical protein STSO111631_08405 [Stackebrandtia soli]